jgi:hypothetical protein
MDKTIVIYCMLLDTMPHPTLALPLDVDADVDNDGDIDEYK